MKAAEVDLEVLFAEVLLGERSGRTPSAAARRVKVQSALQYIRSEVRKKRFGLNSKNIFPLLFLSHRESKSLFLPFFELRSTRK